MANALGIVGWGVGGIEAGASMLGQPMEMLAPEVIGVELTGALARRRYRHRPGINHYRNAAQIPRAVLVGKFVEYIGEGSANPVAARPCDHRQYVTRIRRDHGLLPVR